MLKPHHSLGPGSIPRQSMWKLWWTKWHWGGFSSGLSPPIIIPSMFHQTLQTGANTICLYQAAVPRDCLTPPIRSLLTCSGPVFSLHSVDMMNPVIVLKFCPI
jgi:hypothetical protein